MSIRNVPLEPLALNAAVLLLLALSLTVPSGYSWGAVILLVLGLMRWPAVLRGRVAWPPNMRAWALVILLMGLVWSMHIVADGKLITHSLGLDRSIKYLLVFLVVPALLARRPSEAALNWGCWVGAWGAGLTAIWQVGFLGWDRAAGYTNAIQFGNLALLLAAWSGVRAIQTPVRWQKAIGWGAVLLGVVASITSGSRGGWLTLPALMLLGFWFSAPAPTSPSQSLPRALKAAGVTLAACVALLALPSVQQRIDIGIHEWRAHEQRAEDTSVGLRRSFWSLALKVGEAHPWVGAGQHGYEAMQKEAVARQEIPEAALGYNHAHNEWLDMFAKRGLLGVAGLALFFAVPGVMFARGLGSHRRARSSGHSEDSKKADVPTGDQLAPVTRSSTERAAALCGLMTVLGFVGFGLTQVMFAHNNGTMMYLLAVTLWISCMQPPHASHPPSR
ncbi:O-antigen ligase family protein [Ottowia caeni]|uniref:O-antigen ligase family protein n=1 Tax=Ottowia caeni TaxID=2870339 RepID=UPI001E3311B8|nr:O-antigen ligase family protein [Ottowia caeni]